MFALVNKCDWRKLHLIIVSFLCLCDISIVLLFLFSEIWMTKKLNTKPNLKCCQFRQQNKYEHWKVTSLCFCGCKRWMPDFVRHSRWLHFGVLIRNAEWCSCLKNKLNKNQQLERSAFSNFMYICCFAWQNTHNETVIFWGIWVCFLCRHYWK